MSQRYEVKGKIGQGGLGEVYLAVDNQLGREVALKRVKPAEAGEAGAAKLAEDLIREARTLSALQHPNIVTIFDVGRDEHGPFVVMELLKGETLDAVGERGKLSVDDFQQVVLQTLEGMVAAQAMGLVHRDLKPGNIMVNWLASGSFQVKILDFGLAKFSQMPVPQTQDQGSGIFGSIYFMAPEQFERLPLDGRTDLYSLGCIFYLVLAQKHPFEGRSPVDVMVSHLQHLVTPLHELRRDIPQWMADWVMWLMARDMGDRPKDARQALEYYVAKKSGLKTGAPVPAAPPAQAHRPATPVKPAAPAAPAPAPAGGRTQPVSAAKSQPVPAAAATRGPGHRPRPTGHMNARSSQPGARRVFKERLKLSTVLVGTAILALSAGAIWYVYSDGQKPRPTPRDVLTRIKGDAPAGDAQMVKELAELATYGKTDEEIKKNAAEALAALKRIGGESVPEGLSEALKSSSGDLRDLLIEAATAHPSKLLTKTLTEVAVAETGERRIKALRALKQVCSPADLAEMLAHSGKFTTDEEIQSFYGSVEGVLAVLKDRGSRAKTLAPFLKTADGKSRPHLLRIIGANGSPEASAALAVEFALGGERANAAAEALRTWSSPDDAVAAAAFDAARTGDPDLFVGAYSRTVARIATHSPADIVAGLKKVARHATTLRSRKDFLAALGTLTGPEAIAFAEELTQSTDAAMAEDAQAVLEHLKKQTEKVATLIAGENKLEGSTAVIVGDTSETQWDPIQTCIKGWRSARTRIAFDFNVTKPGDYKVELEQSALEEGFTCSVTIKGDSFEVPVKRTGSSDAYERVTAGSFTLRTTGPIRLWIEPVQMKDRTTLMNLRRVIITAP